MRCYYFDCVQSAGGSVQSEIDNSKRTISQFFVSKFELSERFKEALWDYLHIKVQIEGKLAHQSLQRNTNTHFNKSPLY